MNSTTKRLSLIAAITLSGVITYNLVTNSSSTTDFLWKVPGTNRITPIAVRDTLGNLVDRWNHNRESSGDFITITVKQHNVSVPYGIFYMTNRYVWHNLGSN